MRYALSLLVLSGVMLAATPAPAESCSCMVSGPPCQEVWRSPVVFVGVVADTQTAPGAFGPNRVRFTIREAFRGVDTAEIVLHLSGGGGGSCDPSFRAGETWLVYAHNRRDGGAGWAVSSCSRTRRIEQASEDLSYLRLSLKDKGESAIIGRAFRGDLRILGFDQRYGASYRIDDVPLAGLTVRVRSAGNRWIAKTDAEGRYRIEVSPGTYAVEFEAPPGVVISAREQVTIEQFPACAEANAYASYDGRVSGRLVDARGIPVAHFPISLVTNPRVPLGGYSFDQFTDGEGRFDFRRVQPAQSYLIRPNGTLWEAHPSLATFAVRQPTQ